MKPSDKARERMIEAARPYIRSDRTDPFTAARVMAHIDNGVATISRPENRDYDIQSGSPGFYTATQHREARKMRGSDGSMQTYDVPVYRAVARP